MDKQQKIIILGYGITGKSVYNFLVKSQNISTENIIIIDDSIPEYSITQLDALLANQIDYIVPSPSIDTLKEPHLVIKYGIENDIPIYSDFDLFAKYVLPHYSHLNIIGVTGTNGKSTTVKLIEYLLSKYSNYSPIIAGNIGIPILDTLKECQSVTNPFYILEISSYQIDILSSKFLTMSIILNISPHHLNRYDNIKHYVQSKCNISKYSDKTLISENYMQLLPQMENEVIVFSDPLYLSNNIENKNIQDIKMSPSIANQNLYYAKEIVKYFLEKDLPSSINWENFEPLHYRQEYIHDKPYLKIINDSKSTNICSTKQAIENILYHNKNSSNSNTIEIYLIMGGIFAGENIHNHFELYNNIQEILLIGKDRVYLSRELSKIGYVTSIHDTLDAVIYKCLDSKILKEDGKIRYILFSPACTSFDMWKNFQERGKYFNSLIKSLSIIPKL